MAEAEAGSFHSRSRPLGTELLTGPWLALMCRSANAGLLRRRFSENETTLPGASAPPNLLLGEQGQLLPGRFVLWLELIKRGRAIDSRARLTLRN